MKEKKLLLIIRVYDNISMLYVLFWIYNRSKQGLSMRNHHLAWRVLNKKEVRLCTQLLKQAENKSV